MNFVGLLALALFAVGAIGTITTFLIFDLNAKVRDLGFQVWQTEPARQQFLLCLAFASLGPISALIGILFGGWAT